MTHDLAKQSKASQANIGDDVDHDDDDECDRRFIWNILSVVSLRKEINVSEKFTSSVFRCHGKHFFSALDRSENYFRDSFLQKPVFALFHIFIDDVDCDGENDVNDDDSDDDHSSRPGKNE